MVESTVSSIIGFVVALLVGAFGIYVGGRVITDTDSYGYAIVTALIGSAIWFVVSFFVGFIPLIGPLLALIAYLWVINWRYPGGWLSAAGIALIAWIAVFVIVFLLALLGLVTPEAVGVPSI
jgi:hypothetical protein